jgi:D-aminopeptidase
MDADLGLREHGLRIGELDPGPSNSIADVPSVRVGHVTVYRDEPDPPEGRGVARTGVTAVVPGDRGGKLERPLAAGTAVLNGAGELTGSLEIAEWGRIDTPIYLTATMAVGRVYDGAVAAAMAADAAVGVDDVVIPVVGECDDSWLSDARDLQLEAADVGRAIADAAAADRVVQGVVGAGTGMVCFDYKGGIGSASRSLGDAGTVGVLVLTNFGDRTELRVDGVPVGRMLGAESAGPAPRSSGSCIVVVATDAPLGPHQLTRIARRAGLGLGRTGSVAHNGSGEIFVAFSTATGGGDVPDDELNSFFAATVEATEEAVLNSLWSARTVEGREGRVAEALPHEDVLELLEKHGRLIG